MGFQTFCPVFFHSYTFQSRKINQESSFGKHKFSLFQIFLNQVISSLSSKICQVWIVGRNNNQKRILHQGQCHELYCVFHNTKSNMSIHRFVFCLPLDQIQLRLLPQYQMYHEWLHSCCVPHHHLLSIIVSKSGMNPEVFVCVTSFMVMSAFFLSLTVFTPFMKLSLNNHIHGPAKVRCGLIFAWAVGDTCPICYGNHQNGFATWQRNFDFEKATRNSHIPAKTHTHTHELDLFVNLFKNNHGII